MELKFRHKALYGMTDSGKTWTMKRRAALLISHRQPVIAWSGMGDRHWPRGVKFTDSVDELEEWLAAPKNFKSFLMLDEASLLFEEIGSGKNHPVLYGLAMRGRHMGYTAYFATQYPTSIPRRVRVNCGECYCFRLGDEESAQLVWKDYGRQNFEGRPLWELIMKLKKCEGYRIVSPDIIEHFALK